MKEANGAKVFWGRGNGWVLGGLVEMLRELPAKSKYRPFYQDLFLKLCRRIAPLQGKDGFGMQACSIRLLICRPRRVAAASSCMRWLME